MTTRKYVVHREGTVVFDEYDRPDEGPREIPGRWQLVPRFGSGNARDHAPSLLRLVPDAHNDRSRGGRHLSADHVHRAGGQRAGRQARLARTAPVCVTDYVVDNGGDRDADVSLTLSLTPGSKQGFQIRETQKGILMTSGERLLALVPRGQAASLAAKVDRARVVLSGRLPAKAVARYSVLIPAWKVGPLGDAALERFAPWQQRTMDYWRELLAPAMHVELPDAFLTNVIRASQVHCLLAAHNEDRCAAGVAVDRFRPLWAAGERG